eukprot:TRINITY_DN2777_c0_g1_i1.p1 TRINITY_DN2777_c0_g1~~TRINITY_DN2777_c0_g1_i1.p1  ORF type:complete len:212 (-),score=39.82 TRINITY_DN2777_c0_g1_i1:80-715(-)
MPLFPWMTGYKTTRKRRLRQGTRAHSLRKGLKLTLGSGAKIRDAVKLPPGEDRNEWVAMNTMELYNTCCLLFEMIQFSCTKETCPDMAVSATVQHLWADEHNKKPVSVPAHEYIALLFKWIDAKFDDTELFPMDGKFPKTFDKEVQKILKRMFRVYAHIYYKHLGDTAKLNAQGHLNTCFKHYYYFVNEFSLLSEKDMQPLSVVISTLKDD